MPKHHERVSEKVRRERLLDRERCDIEICSDVVERRKIDVDRKGPSIASAASRIASGHAPTRPGVTRNSGDPRLALRLQPGSSQSS